MVVKILPFPSKLGAGLEDRTLAANPSKPGNIFLMAMMIIFLHCNQGLFLLLNLSRRVFSTQSNPYQTLVFFLHISPTTQWRITWGRGRSCRGILSATWRWGASALTWWQWFFPCLNVAMIFLLAYWWQWFVLPGYLAAMIHFTQLICGNDFLPAQWWQWLSSRLWLS